MERPGRQAQRTAAGETKSGGIDAGREGGNLEGECDRRGRMEFRSPKAN